MTFLLLNVGNFITLKHSPTNYPLWREQAFALAKSQELLGHLTNEDPVPPQYSIPDSSNTPTTETYAPRITKVWTRIFHMRPHSIGETRFLFTICEKLIFEKKLESPLILFLFLKGK